MAFLGLFSGKDTTKELEKIELLLEKGLKEKALAKMESLQKRVKQAELKETEALLGKIHHVFKRDYLEKSALMEQRKLYHEAVEWVSMALDFCHSDAEIQDLLDKKNQLVNLTETIEEEMEVQLEESIEPSHETEQEIDDDNHFDALAHMLIPEVAEYYLKQPQEFKAAYLTFNRGFAEHTLDLLEHLLEEKPEEPVYLFEKARCLMNMEKYEAAQGHFEKVWDFFGDKPLDLAGTFSIPYLWAACCLHLKQAEKVVDRLLNLSSPDRRDPNLTLIIGIALDQAGRKQEVVTLFTRAIKTFDIPDFSFHLGRILDEEGEWQNAIQVLEKLITPSCSSGQCYGPPLHLPSLHLLVNIYLNHDVALDRVEELLIHGDRRLRGQASRQHLLDWSKYHEKRGNHVLSLEAAKFAEKCSEEVPALDETPQLDKGESAVL